jgi:hypothetical protein
MTIGIMKTGAWLLAACGVALCGGIDLRAEPVAGQIATATKPSALPPPTEPVAQPNRDAFSAMRYGIFIHNVYKLTAAPVGAEYESPDEFANLFDVQAFADQMSEIGVEYVIFTLWHEGMYNLGPNSVIEKWLPGHTTRRDLIGDLADALAAKKIALVLYTSPNDAKLSPEDQAKVGFIKNDKSAPIPMPVFNDFMNEVYAEVAERYSKRPNVLGFFWDGWADVGFRLDVMRLRDTLRTNFPEAIVLSQTPRPGVIDFPYYAKDYNRPESDDIDLIPARSIGQCATFAGPWYRPTAGRPGKPVLSAETIFRFTVFNAGAGGPGGMGWAVSPLADGNTWGVDDDEPLPTFRTVNSYIQPIRESLCGVAPSRNWTLPDKTTFSEAPAYVATRSLDGNREYVHILKPGEGKSVALTKPVEEFLSARLLVSGRPVKMERGPDSLVLTLGPDDSWDPLDTVIVLEKTVAASAAEGENLKAQ